MKVFVYVHPRMKPYRCYFAIGVQQFHVCERLTKREANWYVKSLCTALRNAGVEPMQGYPDYIKHDTAPVSARPNYKFINE